MKPRKEDTRIAINEKSDPKVYDLVHHKNI